MPEKSCTKCGQAKPVSDFHLYPNGKAKSWCKTCQIAYVKAKRLTMPKKALKRSPNGMRKPETAQSRRRRKLKEKFGITEHDYAVLLKIQNGVCAICGLPERKIIRGIIPPLSVDHCHATGIVRGLLCHACNIGLGMFRDDPDLMIKAVEYVHGRSGLPKI